MKTEVEKMDELVDQMHEDEKAELYRATLGMEAEKFMQSNLYRYLIERATMHGEEAVASLIDADPNDLALNTKLRSDIRMYMHFEDWLKEAVSSGKNAEQNLSAMDAVDK